MNLSIEEFKEESLVQVREEMSGIKDVLGMSWRQGF